MREIAFAFCQVSQIIFIVDRYIRAASIAKSDLSSGIKIGDPPIQSVLIDGSSLLVHWILPPL